MREIKVKSTRMELLTLKKRIKIAKKGHKLLKDKRDELMKEFMGLVMEVRGLRGKVEHMLAEAYGTMAIAQAQMGVEATNAAVSIPKHIKVQCDVANKGGVEVPIFRNIRFPSESIGGYSLITTSPTLDVAINAFRRAVENLIRLAEKEQAIERMAAEIERTRRRVNALEHVLIPQLEKNAKYIQMHLDELERSNFANLMRIKSMLK